MRISDWSSDVCSSDLGGPNWRVPVPYLPTGGLRRFRKGKAADIKGQRPAIAVGKVFETRHRRALKALRNHLIEREQATLARARRVRESNRWRIEPRGARRSEEHTSELQSLMRISYAVFCLKKQKIQH